MNKKDLEQFRREAEAAGEVFVPQTALAALAELSTEDQMWQMPFVSRVQDKLLTTQVLRADEEPSLRTNSPLAMMAKDDPLIKAPMHVLSDGETSQIEIGPDTKPWVGGTVPQIQWMPKSLPQMQKDPLGENNVDGRAKNGLTRFFIGDEYPRMVLYGPPETAMRVMNTPNGPEEVPIITAPMTPGFWSIFNQIEREEDGTPKLDEYGNHIAVLGRDGKPKPITSWEELAGQKINVSIATQFPEFLKKGNAGAFMKMMEESGFDGKSVDEAWEAISEKTERAFRAFAEDFNTFFAKKGIDFSIDVRKDNEEHAFDPAADHAHGGAYLTVSGFHGRDGLAGFANFCPAANGWQHLEGMGHKKGFLMLNADYCNAQERTEKAIYDLCYHEFCHTLGMAHPHDLAALHMPQALAVGGTVLAYTDGDFRKFKFIDADGNEHEQSGLTGGVLDMYLADFLPRTKEPVREGSRIFDLQKNFKESHEDNALSMMVKTRTGRMPDIPMLPEGDADELHGSYDFNDILDTAPGYSSKIKGPDGVSQGYALVRGHFAKVYGRGGQNEIFASPAGDQEIYPGVGDAEGNGSHIHIYSLSGEKTIQSSRGHAKSQRAPEKVHKTKDTLVLHEDLFRANPDLKAVASGKDLKLVSKNGTIVLKDQLAKGFGINRIEVIDDKGVEIYGRQVSGDRSALASANAYESSVIQGVRRRLQEIDEFEMEHDEDAPDQDHDGHFHGDASHVARLDVKHRQRGREQVGLWTSFLEGRDEQGHSQGHA